MIEVFSKSNLHCVYIIILSEVPMKRVWNIETVSLSTLLSALDNLVGCAGVDKTVKHLENIMTSGRVYTFISTTVTPDGKIDTLIRYRSKTCEGAVAAGRCSSCEVLCKAIKKKSFGSGHRPLKKSGAVARCFFFFFFFPKRTIYVCFLPNCKN